MQEDRIEGSSDGRRNLVVIGASAGGVEVLTRVVRDLPADLRAAICIVLHIAPGSPSMLAHILNFTLLGPLIIYLVKKDEHPFTADQSKEALNFSLVCLIAHVILGFFHILCIGALLSMGLFVVQIVLGIIGGLKARDGIPYRYPLTFRFIK